MNSITDIKNQMQRVLDALSDDLRTLRPGRASAELVNTLPVEVYSQKMPLQQVASIVPNEQGQIVITPWDKTTLGAVETAIRSSQLGFSAVNDGASLRLSLPPLSEERRKELVKIVGQKGEAARIQLRQIRGDAHNTASRQKTSGEMREDELNRFTKQLNEMIDDYNSQVKTLAEAKEKELLTV